MRPEIRAIFVLFGPLRSQRVITDLSAQHQQFEEEKTVMSVILLETCLNSATATEEIDPRSHWDETPLIMAARSQKSLPTCDFLVSEGADMQVPGVDLVKWRK